MAHKPISAIALAGSLAALMIGLAPVTASAHFTPAPCDFITGGGYVFKDNGLMTNFGVNAGCKNGDFWGNVNVLDHENQFHLKSVSITGYLWDPAAPNSRAPIHATGIFTTMTRETETMTAASGRFMPLRRALTHMMIPAAP